MKKITLASFVFYCLSLSAPAQTFSLTSIDTLTVGPVGGVPACHANIKNNGTTEFYVDVVRLLNDTAPNWQTSFCIDVCYPPSVDSARFYLTSGFTQGFLLDFFSDSIPDTTSVFMKFKNVSDPTNVFYQKYTGISDLTFGVEEALKENTLVKIYPSPVISGNTFSFSISDLTATSKEYSLCIYDLCGSRVNQMNDLTKGNNRISLDLPQGLYVYILTRDKTSVQTGKIAVLR